MVLILRLVFHDFCLLICKKACNRDIELIFVMSAKGVLRGLHFQKHRVYRERDHDGTVFSSSDVDIRREDRKQLEEDTVAKREDSIYLFSKHRDATIIASLGYISAIRHLL